MDGRTTEEDSTPEPELPTGFLAPPRFPQPLGSRTQIRPRDAIVTHRGRPPRQSRLSTHSSEHHQVPGAPSTHTELAQSLPSTQGSVPTWPVPRVPGRHVHRPLPHSQRASVGHSRLKMHATAGASAGGLPSGPGLAPSGPASPGAEASSCAPSRADPPSRAGRDPSCSGGAAVSPQARTRASAATCQGSLVTPRAYRVSPVEPWGDAGRASL